MHRTIEDLAREIRSRLMRDGDQAAISDPLGYLNRVAAQIESAWNQRVLHMNIDEDSEALLFVRSAVQSLDAAERNFLSLHILGGLTYTEIAKRLGTDKRIVLRSLVRTYVTLRDGNRCKLNASPPGT